MVSLARPFQRGHRGMMEDVAGVVVAEGAADAVDDSYEFENTW